MKDCERARRAAKKFVRREQYLSKFEEAMQSQKTNFDKDRIVKNCFDRISLQIFAGETNLSQCTY